MHFKDELSYKEIAEKLNISYDNVRKRISQARKILQQRYDQDFLGEDNSKSTVVSDCELRNNCDPIQSIEVNDIEIAKSEDVELSNQESSRNQINIVVDKQSNIERKEVDKNPPNVNFNVLPLLKVLNDGEIGKNRLSNFGEWLNFEIMENLHPKTINAIWQLLVVRGGSRSLTSSFILKISDYRQRKLLTKEGENNESVITLMPFFYPISFTRSQELTSFEHFTNNLYLKSGFNHRNFHKGLDSS